MALAYLVSQMKHLDQSTFAPFFFKAFIVDHKARAGSAAEALKVQGRLLDLGERHLIEHAY